MSETSVTNEIDKVISDIRSKLAIRAAKAGSPWRGSVSRRDAKVSVPVSGPHPGAKGSVRWEWRSRFGETWPQYEKRMERQEKAPKTVKKAQDFLLNRPSGKDAGTTEWNWQQLAGAKLNRGVAKGVKEAIPGFVDNVIGGLSGLVNGTASSIAGSGFGSGWNDSRNFVKKYYSDPLRNLEMGLGGKHVKRVLDDRIGQLQGELSSAYGPADVNTPDGTRGRPEYWYGYRDRLSRLDSLGKGAQGAAELLLSWGPYGKALGLAGKAIGYGAKIVPAAVRYARGLVPAASRTLQGAKAVGHAGHAAGARSAASPVAWSGLAGYNDAREERMRGNAEAEAEQKRRYPLPSDQPL